MFNFLRNIYIEDDIRFDYDPGRAVIVSSNNLYLDYTQKNIIGHFSSVEDIKERFNFTDNEIVDYIVSLSEEDEHALDIVFYCDTDSYIDILTLWYKAVFKERTQEDFQEFLSIYNCASDEYQLYRYSNDINNTLKQNLPLDYLMVLANKHKLNDIQFKALDNKIHSKLINYILDDIVFDKCFNYLRENPNKYFNLNYTKPIIRQLNYLVNINILYKSMINNDRDRVKRELFNNPNLIDHLLDNIDADSKDILNVFKDYNLIKAIKVLNDNNAFKYYRKLINSKFIKGY